jgi:uncharacterized protein
MPVDISEALARRLSLSRERVLPICELLGGGLHPAFIVQYRKAAAAGLDDATLRRLAEVRRELLALEDLRQRAQRQVAQAAAAGAFGPAGAVPEDLARTIAEAREPEVLEDILRPYRPKRRTAGLVAQERGLLPLADYIWTGPADGPDLAVKAAEFVKAEKEVRSPDEALAGASHILADRVADDFRIRQAVRRLIWDKGLLKSQQAKEGGKAAAEFKGYFQFQEAVNRLPPHRVLALNRGERSKALKITIEVPPDALKEAVLPLAIPKGHRFAAVLESVVADALARLVIPTLDREVRRDLTDRAEAHAIEVFAANLRSLLMAKPVRGRRVLAIQPGFRTGCKVAVLGPAGALAGETILYPLEPQKKWDEAKTELRLQIQQHACDLVAIGNGTGCREVEQLVSEAIEEGGLDIQYAIVSEAGAAVYADSDLARDEFPNIEAALRATISIGRRLQDPLAELVKIDPRAIGVGLYQHDVNQTRLRQALEETMEACAAAVGADANSASPALLRQVPGLGPQEVQALVARRATAPIASREELKALPGWTERTFQTAAGFLRVRGSNPLDATRVHPERYAVAEKVLAHIGHSVEDLTSAESAAAIRREFTGLALEPLAAQVQVPLADLAEIIGSLQHPDFDPRAAHHGPVFRRKMRRIEDLAPGMWVKGTVRNVVDFGAFVDIGLKEDGLVHISQFSRRYVRNPLKFLHVGDVVDVRIVSIETAKHRIALTLISDEEKRPQARAPAEAGGEPGTAAAEAAPPGGPRPQPAPRRGPPSRDRRGPRPQGAPPRGPRPEGPRPQVAPGPRRPSAPARAGEGAPQAASAPGDRSRGPRRERRPYDRRPPRSGPPRVIISKGRDKSETRPPDEQGRPKIRWAVYESEIEAEQPADEYEDVEETAAETESPQDAAAEAEPAQAAAPETPGDAPTPAAEPAQADTPETPSDAPTPAAEPIAPPPETTPPQAGPPPVADAPPEPV